MNNIQAFNHAAYISELVVKEDNEDYINAMKGAEITNLKHPNAYLARAEFWGIASAMENQMQYIGGKIIPAKQERIKQLSGRGFSAEDDLCAYKFANESLPHINEERSVDEIIENIRLEIEDLEYSLRVAAISFVVAVRAHDEIARDTDQLTYGAIKAKAAANRGNRNGKPSPAAMKKVAAI